MIKRRKDIDQRLEQVKANNALIQAKIAKVKSAFSHIKGLRNDDFLIQSFVGQLEEQKGKIQNGIVGVRQTLEEVKKKEEQYQRVLAMSNKPIPSE